MSWSRFRVGASLCFALVAGAFLCLSLLPFEAILPAVEMHRVSDGAKTMCFSGVYAAGPLPLLLGSKANAQRIVNACVLACRQRGFVENGEVSRIDEASNLLKPPEGWGNAPTICRG
jgi:hypothetical protein